MNNFRLLQRNNKEKEETKNMEIKRTKMEILH